MWLSLGGLSSSLLLFLGLTFLLYTSKYASAAAVIQERRTTFHNRLYYFDKVDRHSCHIQVCFDADDCPSPCNHCCSNQCCVDVNSKGITTSDGSKEMVKTDPKCPDNCSGHGHCIYNNSKPLCVCNDGWGGVACAYISFDLHADEPLSVTVKDDQFIYFNISTKDPPYNNMTIFIQTFTKDPNAIAPAMYVANGYYPLPSNCQYNDTTPDHRKSLTILNPTAGMWFIALYGRNNPSLILTVQVNMDDVCFSKCSLNGKCQPPDVSGYVSCQCSDGFKGDYCQEYTLAMTNSTIYTGFVNEGFWNYWHFDITVDPTDETYLNLTVTSPNDGHLAPDIYTQMNGHPTVNENICHNNSSSVVTCQVKDKNGLGKGSSWFIGILGSSAGRMGNYTVSATLFTNG